MHNWSESTRERERIDVIAKVIKANEIKEKIIFLIYGEWIYRSRKHYEYR